MYDWGLFSVFGVPVYCISCRMCTMWTNKHDITWPHCTLYPLSPWFIQKCHAHMHWLDGAVSSCLGEIQDLLKFFQWNKTEILILFLLRVPFLTFSLLSKFWLIIQDNYIVLKFNNSQHNNTVFSQGKMLTCLPANSQAFSSTPTSWFDVVTAVSV